MATLSPKTGAKFVLAIGLLLGSVAYVLHMERGTEQAVVADNSTTQTQTTDTTQVQTQPPTNTQPTPTQTTPASQYADGTYTGPVTNAFYGMLQVKATVSGGKLTNITWLQYPNDREESSQINQQAMPLLNREAVAAQSAQVNGVSGATQTSEAFIQSLSGALSQAKNS